MRIETCCTHPLKAFPIGITSNGKTDYKICSYDTDHLEYRNGQGLVACNFPGKSLFAKSVVTDFVEIPCGQCIECRLQRSRRWADRCMLEMQYHEHSWFVTLTSKSNFNIIISLTIISVKMIILLICIFFP